MNASRQAAVGRFHREQGSGLPLIPIVEDDPWVSGFLVDLLCAAGYEVRTTDSAFAAAPLVRQLQPCAVCLTWGFHSDPVPSSFLSWGPIPALRTCHWSSFRA